jgi:hypothetical protein
MNLARTLTGDSKLDLRPGAHDGKSDMAFGRKPPAAFQAGAA